MKRICDAILVVLTAAMPMACTSSLLVGSDDDLGSGADLATGPGADLGKSTTSACPPCGSDPGPGKVCVAGGIVDFSTGTYVSPGQAMVTVGVQEALSLLAAANGAPPIAERTDDSGCFAFTVSTPSSGVLVVFVGDPPAVSSSQLAVGATAVIVTSGQSY